MDVSQIRRLKKLEEENRKLKQMYAELALDNKILKDVMEKSSRARGKERAVLDAYIFRTLNDVREQTEAWMIDYNECRPHESLDNMTPMEYRQKRKAC